MKVAYFLVLLIIPVASAAVSGDCLKIIRCFDNILNRKLNRQLAVQLKGQYTFLYLAQLFDRDISFYKEIASFFRTKAGNHLKHALKIMEYQNQRGGTVEMGGNYRVKLYTGNACADIQSKDAPSAFQCAMQIQANVTNELAELRDDAMGITIDNVVNECKDDSNLTHTDILLSTQSLLVDCKLASGGAGGRIIKVGNWRLCNCNSIKSVQYGELAEMIATDFLNNQSKDRKQMANHYQTLKNTESAECGCTSGIAATLLDASMTPPPADE